ncbi:MAG: hypothetical protein SPE49_00945 [Campylobacter sp.]|nr:hypothetical protein [Campylobacter sp.]MDY5114529.1 hypothetical protein [Campylobacter sp.]
MSAFFGDSSRSTIIKKPVTRALGWISYPIPAARSLPFVILAPRY